MENGDLITNERRLWNGQILMPVRFHDGGRRAAGYRGFPGDCVCRSIAIATGREYRDVYDSINEAARRERPRKGRARSTARDGVKRATIRRYLDSIGWTWTPTMQIGSGCKFHLCADEIPAGRLIVSVSKHITAVIDHVIFDTHDPQRVTVVNGPDGTRLSLRCVYGYWKPSCG